jgi:hypothetical protein
VRRGQSPGEHGDGAAGAGDRERFQCDARVRWLLPTLGAAVFAQVLFAGTLLRWTPTGNETMAEPLEPKNPFDLAVVLGKRCLRRWPAAARLVPW